MFTCRYISTYWQLINFRVNSKRVCKASDSRYVREKSLIATSTSVNAPFYCTITDVLDCITVVLLHGGSICLPRGVKSCLRPVYLFEPSNQRPNWLRGGLCTTAPAAAIFLRYIKFQKAELEWPTMGADFPRETLDQDWIFHVSVSKWSLTQ